MYGIQDNPNPYNLPTPAPGEIAAVSMDSFDKMIESEECDPHDMADTLDADEEAAEGNFYTETTE